MQLKVLSTGSKGNCYLLENEHESLIIELGIRFSRIKQGIGFNINKVVGALCTHEHKDHSFAISDALNAGITVVASKGTAKACKVDHHRLSHIAHGQKTKLGNFEVMAFTVLHDCAEPINFLIRHPETGLIAFITDTYYVPNTFPGLNNIIIEANYCQKIINKKLATGMKFLRDRVIQSHMSIETCKNFLLANDLSAVNNIVLIHLSDSNSNAFEFQKTIENATQKAVTVADDGLLLEFNKYPF
ncbi:MBL fold metallo-hydrolase [Albibacterium profundi]|uniref:MBL fold metallo-hydrolase n=1 Tax=Albibacterium profundi TaxID=3134906 RepID=A0ABV5CF45_9SPHI